MSLNFPDLTGALEDGRIPGMTICPLDEVLLTILAGLLCRMEDFDEIPMFGEEQPDWRRRWLPFARGVARSKTKAEAARFIWFRPLRMRPGSCWCRAVESKGSEITAIPELLDMLAASADRQENGSNFQTNAFPHLIPAA